MKRFWCYIILFLVSIVSLAQTREETISEIRNLLSDNTIHGNTGWKTVDCIVQYSAPVITISTISKRESGGGWSFKNERLIKFDILKSSYENRYYGGRQSLIINCQSGVTEESVLTTYAPYGVPNNQTSSKNDTYYGLTLNSNVIINRLINAFNNLKALANESNVKSTPHMFDDAEIAVQSITFIAPDNTGKLKANQTGCIKVIVKNTNSNSALNVACVVRENNKSELFSYEQYNTVDRINGFETETINVPIKASENVDNSTYPFEVMVTYNGKTIKTQTLNITASNPKKQQSASSTSGSSRNKTVRMRKMAGNTYLISCKVNGLPLDFIFDTGASSVTLSRKQAMFMLKNGYLSKSDIVGSNAYQTASGDIAIGTVIKLKKIDINGLILNNVEASIINSDSAPLLLGQSALSRLGKIQIDYKNSTLTIIR